MMRRLRHPVAVPAAPRLHPGGAVARAAMISLRPDTPPRGNLTRAAHTPGASAHA